MSAKASVSLQLACVSGLLLSVTFVLGQVIKCGHPGDTSNGEFKLVDGKDYTLGSTVEYSCKTGYTIVSRTFRRHCTSKGWNSSIPVCEEIRCPAIHTDWSVFAFGSTRGGSHGEAIEFECGSPATTLDGSRIIHCLENGKWSGRVPTCIEACQLDLSKSKTERTIPVDKLVFRVGESVELVCSHYKREKFTCKHNGQWDYKPTCEEFKCQVPHHMHVHIPDYFFQGDLKLRTKKKYSCESGFHQVETTAVCTRDGWKPDPLCAEILCLPPNIPNSRIVGVPQQTYQIHSKLTYKCLTGLQPDSPVQITCDPMGQWSGIQYCNDGSCEEQKLVNVKVLFGHPGKSSPYQPGHVLLFQCTDINMKMLGQRAIECQDNGKWDYPYPHCGGTVLCSPPISNPQFVTVIDEKSQYNNFETLTYTCRKPYDVFPEGVLMCEKGKWNGTFDCKSRSCPPPPHLKSGDYTVHGTVNDIITKVSYTCQSYYVLDKQQEFYQCVNGVWDNPPKCLRPCEVSDLVEKYNLQPPAEKIFMQHSTSLKLDCKVGWNTGIETKAHVDVFCSNGNLQIDKSCDTQITSK